MKQLLLTLLSFGLAFSAHAQGWQILGSSPTASSFRHDDVFFINADTGWVCNVDGNIYRTNNGGSTWETQLQQAQTSFRCLGFANAQKGWAGNLGTGRWSPTIDTLPLYETNEGGSSWQPVSSILGTVPKGICGINVVNASVVYAFGRVGGPAALLKTTNGGSNWTAIDMSAYAFELIDGKFFSPDTGFVVGATGNSYSSSKCVILYTVNGGNSWQPVASGIDTGHQCWKIHFVNRQTGYVSIENEQQGDSVFFYKTTNGGLSWQLKAYYQSQSWGGQGIGFVDEMTGWCGFQAGDTKATMDGGNTWTGISSTLGAVNRIRKVNDSLCYGVGKRVCKYTRSGTTDIIEEKLPAHLSIATYPNPFTDHFRIVYQIPAAAEVNIRLYDFSGRPVSIIHHAFEAAGEHELNVDLPYYFHTHFYLVMQYQGYQICKKLVAGK